MDQTKTHYRWTWLLVVAVLAAYWNSFSGAFIFDDMRSIVENPYIRSLSPIWQASRSPTGTTLDGRPVPTFTMALNYAISGLDVWSYHVVNLLLHAAAACLVFGVVRRTLQTARLAGRYGAEANGIALTVSLIWALHPLLNESVVYIVQRTETIMGCCLLLMLYAMIRAQSSSRHRVWYEVSAMACLVGMGSKEVMVVAPLVALACDRIFLASTWSELFHKRWGLYLGFAAGWALLVGLVVSTPRSATGFHLDITPWQYLLTEAGVIVYYLRLAVWPSPLCVCYADWPVAQSLNEVLWQGTVVMTLLGLTGWALWRKPAMGFLGAVFFLILAPTSRILPSVFEVIAERRMYIALLPVVVLVVLAAHAATAALTRRSLRPLRIGAVRFGLVASLCIIFILANLQRNRDYRSNLAIWDDTIAKRPLNWRAYRNHGNADLREGRLDDAIKHFQISLRLRPVRSATFFNLGRAFLHKGEQEQAIAAFTEALRLEPQDSRAMVMLGNIYSIQHKPADAMRMFDAAIRANPVDAIAYVSKGRELAGQGRHEEALDCFEQALRVDANCTDAHLFMAEPLGQLGRFGEMAFHSEMAARLNPALSRAHYNAAMGLLKLGRPRAAMAHLEQAKALAPNDPDTQALLNQVTAAIQR